MTTYLNQVPPAAKYKIGDVVEFVYFRLSPGDEEIEVGKITDCWWKGYKTYGVWDYEITTIINGKEFKALRSEKLIIGYASLEDTGFFILRI